MKPSYGGMSIDQFVAKRKHENQKCKDFSLDYLTPEELAEKMKVSKNTVLRMIHTEEIEAVKFGRNWRIPVKQNQVS